MNLGDLQSLRDELLERRTRIEAIPGVARQNQDIARLLAEIDSALRRFEEGTYGLCTVCHDWVEEDRLCADPLTTVCLDHLNQEQRRALEQDLDLALRIQTNLLPSRDVQHEGWEVHYVYRPAGPVSGDFCDVARNGGLFFLIGDVSGKGVAASLLMSHLHATFRTLLPLGLPLQEIVERANRVFCASTGPSQYATLVCGLAHRSGEVELANAGHCPPIVLRKAGALEVESTNLPLGLFADGQYGTCRLHLEPGEAIFLYTDGLTEAHNNAAEEYGRERLMVLLGGGPASGADITEACLQDLSRHITGSALKDDLTMMVVRRAGE